MTAALLLTASCTALTIAGNSKAQAGSYTASTESELRAAIDAANADPDPTATITLTGNITLGSATPFTVPNKPLTINTGAYTLTGYNSPNTATPGGSISFPGGTVIISGKLVGGALVPASSIKDAGIGLALANGSLINNGTITGGKAYDNQPLGNVSAGSGVELKGGTHVNNGTIRGGDGQVHNRAGGNGAALINATLTNNGLIESGKGKSSAFGFGLTMSGVSTLINNGIIRADQSSDTGSAGNEHPGIYIPQNSTTRIENKGTIEGGNGGTGIFSIFTSKADITVVNSGTIKAGPGGKDAIGFSVSGGANVKNTVELHAGSIIVGNVVGSAGAATNTLRLGGGGDYSFNVSTIGATAQYRNFDIFEMKAASTWNITGVATAASPWDIYSGTFLVASGANTGAGIVDVFGGILAGEGTVGPTVNHAGGIIAPGAPGGGMGKLTIAGDYTGNGGQLHIDTALGGDASSTDQLVVTGNTAGNTTMRVTNRGGLGAVTVEGIKVVDVGGTSDGTFALAGDYVFKGEQAVIGGAYAYTLQKNGVSTPTDGDWYLRSALINPAPDVPPSVPPDVPAGPIFQPGVALYETYPQILLQLMSMPTLRERVGNRHMGGGARSAAAATSGDDVSYLGGPFRDYAAPVASGDVASAWWGRVDASRISIEPSSSTAGATYDADQVRLHTGVEGVVYADRGGKLLAGFTVQHGTSWAHVDSVWGNGKINVEGYGIGGTLTWYGASGFYVDGQAQVNWFDTDIRSSLAGAMTEGDDTVGYGISLETGKRFSAGGPWALTPQAQLAYTRADIDFTDQFGAAVSSRDGDSLLGRLGLALDYRNAWMGSAGPTRSHVYGIANLYYEFLDGTAVDVAGVRFRSEKDELWGGLGLGGTYSWGADRYALFGEVSVNTGLDSFGDSYSVNGTAGFRVRW